MQTLAKLERSYIIAFNMIEGIGGRRLAALLEHFGGLERAWHASYRTSEYPQHGEENRPASSWRRKLVDPIREERWSKQVRWKDRNGGG